MGKSRGGRVVAAVIYSCSQSMNRLRCLLRDSGALNLVVVPSWLLSRQRQLRKGFVQASLTRRASYRLVSVRLNPRLKSCHRYAMNAFRRFATAASASEKTNNGGWATVTDREIPGCSNEKGGCLKADQT